MSDRPDVRPFTSVESRVFSAVLAVVLVLGGVAEAAIRNWWGVAGYGLGAMVFVWLVVRD